MAEGLPPSAGGTRSEAEPAGFSGALTYLAVAVTVAGLYFGRDVLVPFALAVLLSFLLAPVVHWLRRLRAGRVTAVSAAVLVAFLAIFAFAAVIAEEVSSLAPSLSEYRHNIEAKIRSLPKEIPLGRASTMLHQLHRDLARSESAAAPPAGSAGGRGAAAEQAKPLPVEVQQPELTPLQLAESVVGPLLQPLATAGLVVVLVVLILLEREALRDRLLRLAGVGDLHRTTESMNDAAQRVSRYLLSQLTVNAACGLTVGIGLTVIGIPSPALWGILAVLLRFVPYIGIVIAACFPLALAIAIDPGWSLVAWTALLYVATELVIANVVEPWLYAGRTGLSSFAVVAAAVFWASLWGPVGLLLSTPLTVCLVVLGRHVPRLAFLDVMLGNEPVLTPEETFYQRLLANDPEEATEQAEEFAKDRSLDQFFDEVALPVLARAQADSDQGVLPAERRARVKEALSRMLENLDEASGDQAVVVSEEAATASQPKLVLCIAGRNELDEAAALMLAHLLRARGYGVQVFPADALAPESGHLFALKDAAIVCLSLVSTNSPARARYCVRRVRRRAPRAMLLLGSWGIRGAEAGFAKSPDLTAADAIVTSLGDAVGHIEAVFVPSNEPASTLRSAE